MFKFNQGSTWRGLALIGSVVAAVTGYGHVFSAEVTQSGVVLGGAVGVAVPAVLGVYEVIRDEFKGG
ncbi:membrane protein (plasmid) [Vibrio sp. qd031]|uniref:hypothetical protein n=1 Tax=Vibrio sp. qd031 TaxID=1603038 RepID=UPI000A0FE14B|nr:hypothetical protein [Vibrio sp. qd031]ORT52514.1 membrane protein [Vibrio sp. qd031]